MATSVSPLAVEECAGNYVGSIKELSLWHKTEIFLSLTVRDIIWKWCSRWLGWGEFEEHCNNANKRI